RPRRGKRLRFARAKRERAPVLPALDLAVVAQDLTLGQRHVSVRARVADGVDVIGAPHERDLVLAHLEPSRGTGRDVIESAHRHAVAHGLTPCRSSLAPTRVRSASATPVTGSFDSTSSKNPVTTSRSAIGVGTPRLSR